MALLISGTSVGEISYIIRIVIADFLITASACFHAAQTISSPIELVLGALGKIIVETHFLVVAPSAKPLFFAAWLRIVLVYTLGVSLNSPNF